MPEMIFPSWAYRLPNVEIASYILDFLPTFEDGVKPLLLTKKSEFSQP